MLCLLLTCIITGVFSLVRLITHEYKQEYSIRYKIIHIHLLSMFNRSDVVVIYAYNRLIRIYYSYKSVASRQYMKTIFE